MSIAQLNPVGMVPTTEGYISSITIYSNGSAQVFTPDGTGKIGITGNALSNAALTNLISGQRSPVGGTLTQVQA